MIDESAIRLRYEALGSVLDERGRRRFGAAEALAVGRGGVSAVSRITGIARSTIGRGVAELRGEREEASGSDRVRRAGGGRKRATVKDPGLLPNLKRLVDPVTRGKRHIFPILRSSLDPEHEISFPAIRLRLRPRHYVDGERFRARFDFTWRIHAIHNIEKRHSRRRHTILFHKSSAAKRLFFRTYDVIGRRGFAVVEQQQEINGYYFRHSGRLRGLAR